MKTSTLENRAVCAEFRVIGPPGTGKTTYLCRQAALALEKYSALRDELPSESTAVLISSLTRAAAAELRRRGLEIHEDQIGTLHSHAWRALGRPRLCVGGDGGSSSKKLVDAFNAECQRQNRVSSFAGQTSMESSPKDDEPGDRWLARYYLLRSACKPREAWPIEAQSFASDYETWKRAEGLLDFSDVIHNAYESVSEAPGQPAVIFVDEAQDHDRAELRLVRRWSERCERLVVVGDPWQAIFEWRGADPEAFYETKLPPESVRVLGQSYRVPRAVHIEAVRMIERIEGREPEHYLPRDCDGEVEMSPVDLKRNPEDVVSEVQRRSGLGQSCMVLASCAYMLRPLVAVLKSRGVPYWNPYAPRSQFNPLHPPRGVSVSQRLLAYLRPSPEVWGREARLWTPQDMLLWGDWCLKDGLFVRGAYAQVEDWAKRKASDPLTVNEIKSVLHPGAAERAMSLDPLWLASRVTRGRQDQWLYASQCLQSGGVSALVDKPRLVVGTIHSVKGGEADAVFLAPDLSPQGFEQLNGHSGCKQIYRLFYVGMTRAREALILLNCRSRMRIDW